VGTHVGKPQVAYRETITGEAAETVEYTQPLGGKSQYAVVAVRLKPVEPAKGIEFVSRLDMKQVPEAFVTAVRQGVVESCSGGELAGYQVIGVHAELTQLGFREGDTTEMACKIAGSLAFRQGCKNAGQALLEPVMKLEVVAPEEFVGPVVTDINGRRGKIIGISFRDTQGGIQIVDAEVPLAEMFGYATALRSLTQGRALYTMQYDRYELTGKNVQETILKKIGRA
jgi:elongation factor G